MLANIEKFYIMDTVSIVYGMWCSLAARLTGGQEVASSSLVIPILRWLKHAGHLFKPFTVLRAFEAAL